MYRGPNNLNNLNEDLDEELPSRSECEDIHIVKSKPNVYFEAEWETEISGIDDVIFQSERYPYFCHKET